MTARHDGSARARTLAARWTSLTFVLGFTGLGACWAIDRSRTWEEPRWTPSHFVALRGDRVPAPGKHGLVVVAVNTSCPHCLETLATLGDSLEPLRAAGRAPRLVALVVDAAVRPGPGELARVRAPNAAWDSSQIWRHRWGRRLYGEVLRFDASGAWIPPRPRTLGARPPTHGATQDGPRITKGGEDS